MSRLEIRFAGTGGQGIISAAILLGEAIALFDNRYATQTQSYGPESRGSAARADVVISDIPIDFPKVVLPDILVIMSQAAFEKYIDKIKPNSIIIVDPMMIISDFPLENHTVFRVPATPAGETISRKPIVTNIVMLGALSAIRATTSLTALEQAIEHRWPRLAEPNIRALHLGYQLGAYAKKQANRTAVFPLPSK